MFHRSQNLLLRPVWPEDWQAIYSAIADEGIVRNLARAPWPYEEQHARDFAELPQQARSPRFLIIEAATRDLVGCIGIDPTRDPKCAEIGYWIARHAWGKGYATEAGFAALTMARVLGYNRVEAGHFIDNPASGRVLEKLGLARKSETAMRHSLARGEDVESIEYALELS